MEHDQVDDRKSFAAYVGVLRQQLISGGQDWENIDLPSFLEAMQAWAQDSQQAVQANPWRHAAEVITAAIGYE
ncbi:MULTISPECIES: hypothetical protein [unclassified Brevundimonas]|uniref:DUF7660 family protein n=1 Tax=unclassified Brevundimonas TaxID=2622653 RepID=UPI0025BA5C03|nr:MULTISPECIES: hypothetical protein [unclassified Brevundimonas]